MGTADSLGISVDGKHAHQFMEEIEIGTVLIPAEDKIIPFLRDGQPYMLEKDEEKEIRPSEKHPLHMPLSAVRAPHDRNNYTTEHNESEEEEEEEEDE